MNVIKLDGKLMKKEGHDYLINAFNFPDYYGRNLDALYDCLTDIACDTKIELSNANFISKDCIDTFTDASDANSSLTFFILDDD